MTPDPDPRPPAQRINDDSQDSGVSDPSLPFPIVGIGASAGGIGPLATILDELPDEPGMAFVIVQHLSPEHRSELAELLDQHNLMPVMQIEDGTKVKVDHVYVIPPSKALRLEDGCLNLGPKDEKGHGFVIDAFMTSLAEDQGDRAVAILLSGSLNDGVVGLRRVREAGGISIVQDPDSADFDEMPRAALSAGVADFVLEPNEIGSELGRLVEHPYLGSSTDVEMRWPEDELDALFNLLQKQTSVDFKHYKETTLKRRIHRRITATRTESLQEYVEHLRQTPEELEALKSELLILVTRFFRDADLYETLENDIIPRVLEDAGNDPIRIWAAGCSTGEEAYSLAILLDEHLKDQETEHDVQIFATDISQDAIQTARDGTYPPGIETEISPARLNRYFKETETGYEVKNNIRSKCIFSIHDLTSDPPFSNIDMTVCRNVAIYMTPALQDRVFTRFHYALAPDGILVLGPSESPGRARDLYENLDVPHPIFRARPGSPSRFQRFTPAPSRETPETPQAPKPPTRFHEPTRDEAANALINRFAPPALIVAPDKNVEEFIGDTNAYLKHPEGQATENILHLVREGLAPALGTALDEAQSSITATTKTSVRYEGPAGRATTNIEVIPLRDEGKADPSFLVVFVDPDRSDGPSLKKAAASLLDRVEGWIPDASETTERTQELEDELESTRDYLRSVIEQYEATNEELRSANEESLSANEELQATNEELETAKEELQATNEELVTLNQELEERNKDVQRVNDDLENLLRSAKIPIVMVDQNLKIRRFTPDAKEFFNIIGSDTGRPLTDLNLPISETTIEERMLGVLKNLDEDEMEIEDENGRPHRIRMEPYRTSENKIDGVVLVVLRK